MRHIDMRSFGRAAAFVLAALLAGPPVLAAELAAGPRGEQPARPAALRDLQGRPATLEDYQREVLLVDFWATWCLPCRVQVEVLNAFFQNSEDPAVAIVGVAVDENIDDVVRFVRQHELRYPVLVGSEALARAHGVEVYPTLVIRRPGGASRIGHVGVASDQALQELLGAGAAADGAEPGGR